MACCSLSAKISAWWEIPQRCACRGWRRMEAARCASVRPDISQLGAPARRSPDSPTVSSCWHIYEYLSVMVGVLARERKEGKFPPALQPQTQICLFPNIQFRPIKPPHHLKSAQFGGKGLKTIGLWVLAWYVSTARSDPVGRRACILHFIMVTLRSFRARVPALWVICFCF